MRFGYGSIVPWVQRIDGGISAIAGPDCLRLHTPVETRGEDLKTVACISSPERRTLINDPADIPALFVYAILASEDKNFFEHKGIDKAAILRRYRNANNKVVVRSPTSAVDGRFEIEIELPDALKPGKYFLKAYGPGSIGSREILIPE